MEIKKVFAIAVALMVAGFIGMSQISTTEHTSLQTDGDAASALGNLTDILEEQVDTVVS